MRSEIGNNYLGWPDDNPHPLPVIARWSRPKSVDSIYYGYGYTYSSFGVRAFRRVYGDNVTLKTSVHTSENASEKHHYFALAFTGMNSVPSRLRELWRQPVYTHASILHALSCACACIEKHPLTAVSVMRHGKLDVILTVCVNIYLTGTCIVFIQDIRNGH